MATKSASQPEILFSDARHFKQSSEISEDQEDMTSATHSVSLDLQDPAIASTIKAMLEADPQLVADTVAEDPALAEYLVNLGITIPQNKPGDSASSRIPIPIPIPTKDDQDFKKEETVVPDRQLRISKASLDAASGGRFSMLIGVTQGALNAQLFFRWADLDRPELRTIVAPAGGDAAPSSVPEGVFIDADLAAPQIALLVQDEATTASARFYLNFLSGSCALWDSNGGNLQSIPSTFGWKIAFKIDLQLANLDKNSSEYRALAHQWQLPPSYGISALIASFNNATIDLAASTFPTPLSTHLLPSLTGLLLEHLRRQTLSINYTITNPGAAPLPDPTLPPTAQRLQTYPHHRTFTSGEISPANPNNDHNALLYLGTTTSPPSLPPSRLPWKANWVPSEENNPVAGCLAISREDFLEGFLLDRLTLLNRATYFEMTFVDTKKTGAAKAEYRFSIGRKNLSDGAFRWSQVIKGGNATMYIWTRSSQMKDEAGASGFKSRATGTTFVRNILIVRGGTNRIHWQTQAAVKWNTELETFWIKNKGVANALRTGSTDLVIKDVLDGKLGLEMEMAPGWIASNSTGGSSFGFQGTDMAQLADKIESKYLNLDHVTALVDSLNTRLTRQWAFVLPGGGSFLMKNPVLSDAHDLLVDLTYNGVQRKGPSDL